jgi:hypothetical protein
LIGEAGRHGATRRPALLFIGLYPRIGIERLSFGDWLKAPTLRERRRAELLNAQCDATGGSREDCFAVSGVENDSGLCRVGARRVALAVSSGFPRAERVCPSRPSPNPLCKFPSDGLSRDRLPTRDVTIARVIPAPFLPLPLSSFARNSPRC